MDPSPHSGRGLRAGVESLIAPLRAAMDSDFSALGRVRDLVEAFRTEAQIISKLSIPGDLRDILDAVSRGLATLGEPGERIDRAHLREIVGNAIATLEPWQRPGFCDDLLERPLSVLPGVGPKRAEALARRGLRNVGDLLFHLPTRYDDRRSLASVAELEVGRRATFLARVKSAEITSARTRGRFTRILQVVVGDDSGSVNLKWFRGASSLHEKLVPGTWLVVTGDVKRYRFSKEIVHPEIELGDPDAGEEAGESAEERAAASRPESSEPSRSVVPDYPTPEGVNSRTLRRLIREAVAQYSDCLEGLLPQSLIAERGLPDPGLALRLVHAPELEADVEHYLAFRSPAHERLVLEELYLLQLGLVLRRDERGSLPGIAIAVDVERVRAAEHSLPFQLTAAQLRAWKEIQEDLARPHPMNRLLQGDVGSGKTAVALLAAVAVAASGKQTALMAPTELLAEQHARSFETLARGASRVLGLRSALLTSSVPRAEAAAIKEALAKGELDLVIGTHALVQEGVEFRDLALAIIDEQHRFGVRQRQALAERGGEGAAQPDVLVMTATPIPRTLALTAYGDLETSVIDELPPGRTPCETLLFRQGDGPRIMELIESRVDRGEQVYVVYPLVEESEKLDLRSAIESAEKISAAFPNHRVELVHGRLDSAERNATMQAFSRGKVSILVATTVIEVGVDVPNATLMVIEHAERFGLAQLHQLRGRVGRGERPGTCVLVARARGRDASARLDAMVRTHDGFEIANEDLRIRGPGEFLGTRQSGDVVDLRLADLVRDARLVAAARQAAIESVCADPALAARPALRRAVEARWGERLDLSRVG